MLRKISFIISLLVLFALGAVALSGGNAKSNEIIVTDSRIAGLMSCMVKKTCKSQVKYKKITESDAEILILSYVHKDYDLEFLFNKSGMFGINVKTDDGKNIGVDDVNLDGIADFVYTNDNAFSTEDQRHFEESVLAQEMFHEALQVGWDNFVPDDIKAKLIPPTTKPAEYQELERFKT